MLEKYEICCDLFHGFDWSQWITGTPAQKLGLLPAGAGAHPGGQEGRQEHKQKFCSAVTRSVAGVRAGRAAREGACAIRDDVGFFQAVRAVLAKSAPATSASPPRSSTHAIRQIISQAVASDEVVDIFAAAGLEEAGHLDPLRRVPGRGARHAAEEPRRRAAAQAAERRDQDRGPKKFVIQSRSFAEMLEQSIRKYQNRAIETAQVIEELIAARQGHARRPTSAAKQLGLTEDEAGLLRRAGSQRQRREGAGRADACRSSPASWWRPSATTSPSTGRCARTSAPSCASLVKRILRKYGYPPDKQEKATQTVLEQAELLCADWAG